MATIKGRRSRQVRVIMIASTLVAAVIAVGVSEAPASRKPSDVQATNEYVSDYVTRSHELHRLSIEGRERLGRFVKETVKGCRGVLVNAPNITAGSGPIQIEISETLDLTLTRAGAPAFANFGHRVGQIRWTRPATNIRARAVARASSSFANALPKVPKLCSDLIAWKDRQFRGTPSGTLKFDHEMTTPPIVPKESLDAKESELGRMLQQYKSTEDQLLLQKAKRFIEQTAIENFTVLARDKTLLIHAFNTPAGKN